MSFPRMLIQAGALYAIGRYASRLRTEDVEGVTGISARDAKGHGLGRADALLHQVGLQRASTVPNATAIVFGGFAAGAIVGAGITFLFYSEQGKEVRRLIGQRFTREGAETESAEPAVKSAEPAVKEAELDAGAPGGNHGVAASARSRAR